MINKTDFEISIYDQSTTIGDRKLEQQGLEGDSVEFWADPGATHHFIFIKSLGGNLALTTDDFYNDLLPVIEIHYEAKEKKLFYVFSSDDTVAGVGDNDKHDMREQKYGLLHS